MPSQFGSPIQTLQESLIHLNRNDVHIRAVSRFFQTPCFPAEAGPDYVNAAVAIHTTLSAAELLTPLHKIESTFGRERLIRWGTRPLDIALLGFESQVRTNSQRRARRPAPAPDASAFPQIRNVAGSFPHPYRVTGRFPPAPHVACATGGHKSG